VNGKVLLVTGGSRGIGAATALEAAKDGWRVAVNFLRDEASADSVVAAIIAVGGQACAIQADVSDPAAIKTLFAEVEQQLGPISGLVNNAGVVDEKSRVENMDAARIERMFRINSIGPMLCAAEAVLRMSKRHGGVGGVIVNLSSAAARLGSPGEYVDYAASKAAIDTFTKGLALEVADEGIRVNAVRPGIIDTDIHASGGQPDRAGRISPLVPMKRAGTADEVAQAIVWLLSDKASYITGSIVDVSGGR
jgi:NAD(P)-dependent dehydrogenase (short-subunit alcohol dehydrogenase family)